MPAELAQEDPGSQAPDGRPCRAVILSGGGARGAYEAGVLSYVFGDLASRVGRPPRIDIYSGTSVGAVHACYLAANAHETEVIAPRLAAIWEEMSFSTVYRFTVGDAMAFVRTLAGFVGGRTVDTAERPDRIHGLLNTTPLERLVVEKIPWRRLRRNVRSGLLSALCITTTEIGSGRTVVFIDTPDRKVPSWTRDPHVVPRASIVGPTHALASAAIPFLFPAVRVGRSYYCDGGLRMHSPLSPALRLGADRVLVVGLSRATPVEEAPFAGDRVRHFMSAGFLLGKVLNALLMDRIENDLAHMRLLNRILELVEETFGPGFFGRLNRVAESERGLGLRVVRDCFIQPSEDIGQIAALHVRRLRKSPDHSWIGNVAFRALTRGAPEEEADLMSYLLFDGDYARELMALGRSDAAAREEELARFFDDDAPARTAAPA